ncbi:hypothetical protein JCM19232_3553 [Vibrio ishigakensis]|uniref:Uncharacterized protein n=1 Tax=Vibrio ishigakensis TaxID=1481914 RepID=A0A0B8P2Z9_9VIBR|nr:hypothetical protein JCM19232_3553 [Vibrio ishigakensis]
MLLMLITLGSGSAVASDWSVSSEGERADATPSERMTFAALKPAFWGDDQRLV